VRWRQAFGQACSDAVQEHRNARHVHAEKEDECEARHHPAQESVDQQL